MTFPRLVKRLPRLQERIVLECVVQLLVDHELCLIHEGMLIFPSLFQPSERDGGEVFPHAVSLYYDFSGAIDNIYSSLVASLALGEAFGPMRLWESRAEFARPGKPAAGVRKVERGGGLAHLDVYFEDPTDQATTDLFMSFIDQHLHKHGVEIREHVEITCACGFRFPEELLRRRIAASALDVGCPSCDRRIMIADGVQPARARDAMLEQRTWALRTKIDEKKQVLVERVTGAFPAVELGVERGPLRILHLGDLLLREGADGRALVDALSERLGERLDYLVLSGDLTASAQPAEFERARVLVSALIARFQLTAERTIVVPGNHDCDWKQPVYEWRGRRPGDTAALAPDSFVEQEKVVGVRVDERYPARFQGFSKHFFHPLFQREYGLEFARQGHSLLFADAGLQFLALNSAWQVDEFFPRRAGVHPAAFERAVTHAGEQLKRARERGALGGDAPVLRIAVWHHPLAEGDFRAQLAAADVRLGLHGAAPEEAAVGALQIIGAGAQRYNLVELERDQQRARLHSCTVAGETRTRELILRADAARPAVDNGLAAAAVLRDKEARGDFDVFLAHNSRDKPQVRVLAAALRRRGINPWIDEQQIPPGRWWQDVLLQAITQVRSAAICMSTSGLGRWQALELKTFISQCVEKNLPVIPVLLPGTRELPHELPLLRELHYVKFEARLDEPDGLDNLEWGITGKRPRR
jgi:hypothetical protein